MDYRVNFELEPGVVGQAADFKESNKRLEWNMKKVTNLSASSCINRSSLILSVQLSLLLLCSQIVPNKSSCITDCWWI